MDAAAVAELAALLEDHAARTGSEAARRLLAGSDALATRFVRVRPAASGGLRDPPRPLRPFERGASVTQAQHASLHTLERGSMLPAKSGAGGARESPKGDRMATEAYCVKCRAKKTMKDEKAVTMKNGKPATQGVCPDCGTKMFKIGKSK